MHCEASDLQTINHDSRIGRVTEWQGPPAIIAAPVSSSPSTSPRCGPCRWAATHGSSASAHRPMMCILRGSASQIPGGSKIDEGDKWKLQQTQLVLVIIMRSNPSVMTNGRRHNMMQDWKGDRIALHREACKLKLKGW